MIMKCKDILCCWVGRINTVKMDIFLKAIHIFNTVSIKIPRLFFTELDQIILKHVWDHRKSTIAK